MRSNQFINEIQRISPITPGHDIYVPRSITHDDLINKSKKLPGNNPYRYTVRPTTEGTEIYMINVGQDSSNTIIGRLVIEPIHFPLKKAGYVDYITVSRSFTGMGIAKSLYGIWLSILKRPLVAGSMQSPGGRRNWVSLNKIPGVIVKGYITISEYNFDNQTRARFNKVADAIMNTGANYIGKDGINTHYFEFDVEANTRLGELQAVYKKVVAVYNNDYDSVSTGLYAVWTGAK
jgi:hypothetical protein